MTRDDYAMHAAEIWIREYTRMMQCDRKYTLQYAMITDAGPQVIRGFKLLCEKAGIVRNPDDFVNRET